MHAHAHTKSEHLNHTSLGCKRTCMHVVPCTVVETLGSLRVDGEAWSSFLLQTNLVYGPNRVATSAIGQNLLDQVGVGRLQLVQGRQRLLPAGGPQALGPASEPYPGRQS